MVDFVMIGGSFIVGSAGGNSSIGAASYTLQRNVGHYGFGREVYGVDVTFGGVLKVPTDLEMQGRQVFLGGNHLRGGVRLRWGGRLFGASDRIVIMGARDDSLSEFARNILKSI